MSQSSQEMAEKNQKREDNLMKDFKYFWELYVHEHVK